jgi:phosphate transport system substrate-binding protein
MMDDVGLHLGRVKEKSGVTRSSCQIDHQGVGVESMKTIGTGKAVHECTSRSHPRKIDRPSMKWRLFAGAALLLSSPTLVFGQANPAMPASKPLPFPTNATYMTPDGAIRIIGTDSMRVMLERANDIFIAAHPGFRFRMELKGGYVALPGLTHGVTALSPMARNVTAVELEPYRALVASDPLIIRVAHGTVTSQTRTAPLGIYVSRNNPIQQISLEQLARVFASGNPAGDITCWGQLGLSGEWADRPIHTVGTPEDSGFGSFMVENVMHGRPFVAGFTQLLSSVAIIKRLSEDSAAIGFSALAFETPQTKLVAVAKTEGGPYMIGTADDIESGNYALDRFVYIFLPQPLESWMKEYMRVLLSHDVQRAIAEEPGGFLPLNAEEIAAELAKIK